jgi:hypothetical protein
MAVQRDQLVHRDSIVGGERHRSQHEAWPFRVSIRPETTTDAREAVGGRPEPSADLLRQLDDDPLRAADVAEPIAVFVALHLADELRTAGSQAGDDGVDVVDCECEMRRSSMFLANTSRPPSSGGTGEWADAREKPDPRRRLTAACPSSESWRILANVGKGLGKT